MSRVVVVGAGIAGLAAATHLAARHDVTVLERDDVAGGKVRTERIDGFTFDRGPNGVLWGSAEVRALVHDAGLDEEVTEAAAAAAKRFVYWNGALHALPAKPPQALAMSLLSPAGKLRALGDLFARAPAPRASDGAPPAADESVDAFVRRHFGAEVAERIVAPALLGVSGGEALATSLDALFPRLRALEAAHGSIIRGMVRTRANPGRLSAFGAAGMQRLTDRLAEMLGDRVRLGCAVESIEPSGGGWRVTHAGGVADAEAAIVTSPSDVAAQLVDRFDGELAALLRAIPYAPMRVIGIAFRARDVPTPLDGFGFLAARGQGVRILGALYTSSIFPAQAPPETAYLRVFLGGAADPDAVALEPDRAQGIVRADLQRVLGIAAEPVACHEALWPRAIPQYGLGHRALVARIDERAATHSGLFFTGNAYRGVGVADTVREARRTADRATSPG